MRWDSGALYLVRRLTGALTSRAAWMIPRRWFWVAFVVGALAMIAAPHMAKAQDPGGVLTATSITGASRTSTGLTGTLNAVLLETERRAYYQAAVSVPWGTLGAAARAGARGVSYFLPYAGMALTAAQLYGWAQDGDWFNLGDGAPSRDLAGATYIWCFTPAQIEAPATYCSDNQQQIADWVVGRKIGPSDPGVGQVITHGVVQDIFVTARRIVNGSVVSQVTAIRQTVKPSGYRTPEHRDPTPVTDQEMAQAIANNPSNYTRMLHDVHGVPYQFPEVRMALGGMAAGIGNATGTTPSLGGQEVNPNQSSPNDPAPQPGGAGSELPAFCEWAGVVCEFIEWFKEDEPLEKKPVEWDEEQVEPQTWNSPISGNGSCPAPEVVSVWGESVEFSYQPLCDLVSLLRYVIILGATLVAAYIVAGVRGSNV